jgi:hypothetical protein
VLKVKYDLDFAFRCDWRLEGSPDGGADGKDYALRCGEILEVSGEKCAACNRQFKVGDSVEFLVFGYPELSHYREIPYCPFCLPKQWRQIGGSRDGKHST